MLSLNTHDYDGKLGNMIALCQPHISNASNINVQIKLLAFTRLQVALSKRPGFKGEAYRNFLIIVSDYKRGGNRGTNYDPSNNLHAADLLYICGEVLVACQTKDTDVADIIIEQLVGMSGGMCAQGRTHRLMGIIPALLELLPKN